MKADVDGPEKKSIDRSGMIKEAGIFLHFILHDHASKVLLLDMPINSSAMKAPPSLVLPFQPSSPH